MTAQRVSSGDALTVRELEILRGMALGKQNKEIGAELWLTEETIKSHAQKLFRKLGARDRANAVWLGVLKGILVSADGEQLVAEPQVPAGWSRVVVLLPEGLVTS